MEDFHAAYYRQKAASMEPGKRFMVAPGIQLVRRFFTNNKEGWRVAAVAYMLRYSAGAFIPWRAHTAAVRLCPVLFALFFFSSPFFHPSLS